MGSMDCNSLEASVPTPRKTVTLAPPKKGSRGILLAAGEAAAATTPRPLGLAPVLPRLGLNPVQTPPQSDRTKARRERAWKETQDIAEARHALRSATPGEWDARLFCKLRQQFMADGRWHAVAALHEAAARASRTVLDCGSYASLEPNQPAIKLPQPAWAKWHTMGSLTTLVRRESAHAPPLICSPLGPLELAKLLATMFPGRPLTMSFEATDFSEESGELLGATEARGTAQKEMMLRTTLEFNSRTATALCRTGATPQGNLTARTDPQIMAAEQVVVFRGPSEQGFPFLAEKDQTVMRVLVAGRTTALPLMMGGKKGEIFAMKEDFSAVMERLHLIGLAALPSVKDHGGAGEPAGTAGRDSFHMNEVEPRPVLVISAHDLTVAAAQQPRQSIASALQAWRRLYADLFQAVVVACGDAATAALLDQTINCDIYAGALSGQGTPPAWHWRADLLELSVNAILSRIGARARPAEPCSPAASTTTHGADTTRTRRPSAMQLCMLAEAALKGADKDGSSRRASRIDPAQVPQAVAGAADQRGGSLSVPLEGGLPQRRASVSECQDSRSAYERAVANRMADANVHERGADPKKSMALCQKPATQLEARFGSKHTGGNEPAEAEQQAHETMTLDRLRMLEQNASLLAMPEEVKVHVVKMVEASWAEAKTVQDEAKLLGEVRDLAGSLESRLEQCRALARARGIP